MLQRKIQKIVEFVTYEFSSTTYVGFCLLFLYFAIRYLLSTKKIPTRFISILPLLLGFFLSPLLNHVFMSQLQFNPTIFYALTLPPIIFNIGYNIKISTFSYNLPTLTVFSIICYLFKSALFVLAFFVLNQSLQLGQNARNCFFFISILCINDAGTIYSPIKKWRKNTAEGNVVVEGSILTNIIAFAIYRGFFRQIMRLNQGTPYIRMRFVYEVSTSCIYYFFFSLSVAIILALTFKTVFSFDSRSNYELLFLLFFVIGSFFLVDLISLHGMISLLVFAIMINFKKPQITMETKEMVKGLSKTLSQISQDYVMIYVGFYFYEVVFEMQNSFSFLNIAGVAFFVIIFIEILTNSLLGCAFRYCETQLSTGFFFLNCFSSMTKGSIAFILAMQTIGFPEFYQWLAPSMCILCFFTHILGTVFVDPIMRLSGIEIRENKEQENDEIIYENIGKNSEEQMH